MSGATLPDPSREPDPGDAVEALLRIASTETGRHDLVTLGPLTNIAAALEADPGFLGGFGHTYLMAGAPDGVGNTNPLGEYNVWADPEAATAVLAADGPKTLVGWNISRRFAVLMPEEQERLRRCGPLGAFAVEVNAAVDRFARDIGLAGFDLPDPITVAVALDLSIITDASDEWLVVGIDGPTRGCTLPDRRFERPAPNIRVVWSVDEAAFKRRLFEASSG
jgi:purine nucleosidase